MPYFLQPLQIDVENVLNKFKIVTAFNTFFTDFGCNSSHNVPEYH